MSQSFYEQVQEFVALARELQQKGIKKKEIAHYLELHASAYSTMQNTIFQKIAALSAADPRLKEKIAGYFEQANNISERKVRQQIQQYIARLTQFLQEVATDQYHHQPSYIEELVAQSPSAILEKLEGIYECYYVSSFGYRVKCEPFMISKSKKEERFMAYKGNKLGPAYFTGFLYVTNNHILTVQMLEVGTINKDHFMVHFILPPTYDESLSFLKGIAVSISNAYFPMGRKVILKKIHASPARERYENMPTVFYEEELPPDDRIITYLRTANSLIEYIPIPHPGFDENDLQKELVVQQVLRSQPNTLDPSKKTG